MEKKSEAIFTAINNEFKFMADITTVDKFITHENIDTGELGQLSLTDFLAIYSIQYKSDKGLYSKDTADILELLYRKLLLLNVNATKDYNNEELRNLMCEVRNILYLWTAITHPDLKNMIEMQSQIQYPLPDEDKLKEYIKKV